MRLVIHSFIHSFLILNFQSIYVDRDFGFLSIFNLSFHSSISLFYYFGIHDVSPPSETIAAVSGVAQKELERDVL